MEILTQVWNDVCATRILVVICNSKILKYSSTRHRGLVMYHHTFEHNVAIKKKELALYVLPLNKYSLYILT